MNGAQNGSSVAAIPPCGLQGEEVPLAQLPWMSLEGAEDVIRALR
jgi:hypothetical protein